MQNQISSKSENQMSEPAWHQQMRAIMEHCRRVREESAQAQQQAIDELDEWGEVPRDGR